MNTPLSHALLAEGYICLVAFLMFYGQTLVGGEDVVIMPVAMLSLLTLSGAVMCYLFCYRPLTLFIEGKKEESLHFFLKTIFYFGFITFCVFVAMIVVT
jgi:hypothetical protein